MFSRFFIDRPIFSAVMSIIIALAGGLALVNLPISQYPEISPPAVTIQISYPGASAQVVADTVAAPIEQQMNGVPGMLYMSSSSGNDGSYSLTVTFEIGTNLNAAMVMAQNRVQLALPQLPAEVQRQGITVRKRTPDILLIASVTCPDRRYDTTYLSNYATINMRDELLRLEGVSDVTIFGQRDYSMRIWLDPQVLAAKGVTAGDVAAAVRRQNLEVAPGRVGQPPMTPNRSFQFPLDVLGRLTTPEQFGDIIVKAAPPRQSAATTSAGTNTAPVLKLNPVLTLSPFNASSPGTSTNGSASLAAKPTPTISLTPDSTAVNSIVASTVNTSGPANTPPRVADAGGGVSAVPMASSGSVGPLALSGGETDGGPNPAAGIVYMRNIARIEPGAATYENGATYDAEPSIGLAIRLLAGANALDVGDRVRQRLDELQKRFPEGVQCEVGYDTTPYIRESVQDVVRTLFEAVGLVSLVVLVFLQNWRAAIIPMVAVPVSILGTFAAMLALGFTINNISLFGLVLAIGIVVDDAIVVVENVERWLEHGLSPKEAAYKAMGEVTGPIVAIALVLCTVFIPCAFVGGIPGQFYRQFAVTITASTVFSTISSLTLSPALAALLMRKREHSRDVVTRILDFLLGWFFWLFNRSFSLGTRTYAWVIGRLLRVSLVVVILYFALIGLTWYTFDRAPIGFVPEQDQGRLIVSIQLPDSVSLSETRVVLKKLEAMALEVPGVSHTTTSVGTSFVAGGNASNYGTAFIVLAPISQRQTPDMKSTVIAARLRKQFATIRDADIKVFGAAPVPGLGVAGGYKIVVEDRGGRGLSELQKQTDALVAKLQKDPNNTSVLTSFRSRTPQLFLEVDRTKVESLGVDLNDVNQTMQIYIGSVYANSFNAFGRDWQVKLQAEGRYRDRTPDINLLQVRNDKGEMIPLGTLVKVKEINGPLSITRYNLYTAAAVNGNVPPGVSSGEAIASVNRISEESLPRSMAMEWTELFYLQIRTGNTAIYVFLVAVVFVFLALAALYESWAMPLAVILVVPLCLLCSVGGVVLAEKSVDIFVQIGLVVLVGLACKNAILIVEFAEVLRREGKPRDEAALEASRLRLRPILMTSLAFVLGVLPLAVATGAGAEMRRSLGFAVLCGMLGVTAFGIFMTPVFFVLIQRGVDAAARAGGASYWGGLALVGALLGAGGGYLIAKLGAGHTIIVTILGTVLGMVCTLTVPLIRLLLNQLRGKR